MKFEITQSETKTNAEILDSNEILMGDQLKSFKWMPHKDGSATIRLGDAFYKVYNISVNGNHLSFQHKGHSYRFIVKDEMAVLVEKMGYKDAQSNSAGTILSPMPGKIISILVEPGQQVETGKPVIILEAMKMENEIKTTINGTVKSVNVEAGQSVEKNELLLEIE